MYLLMIFSNNNTRHTANKQVIDGPCAIIKNYQRRRNVTREISPLVNKYGFKGEGRREAYK